MSETEIIRLIAGQGPFAVLFVILLFWVLRENAKREERLMEFLSHFSKEHAEQSERLETIEGKLDRVLNNLKRR